MTRQFIHHCLRSVLPLVLLASGTVMAQGFGSPPLGEGPFVLQTAQTKVQVSVVVRGLEHPWSLAFLPNGDMLITERAGRLRLVHEGVLASDAISGLPPILAKGLLGLMDVLPHPDFAQNQLLYFTYNKEVATDAVATVLGRAKLEGMALTNVEELLVSDTWNGDGAAGGRLLFGSDGKLYMGVGATRDGSAQDPALLRGKILRLNADGSVPSDNPFVGKDGYRPEIFTMGHRNPSGISVSPATGEIWAAEYGPNGGDEINIIKGGNNYGWPLVSYGRDYPGPFISPVPYKEGMEGPVATFIPGISPSGLAFYTGTDFPTWTTSAFVGAQRVGQMPGTGKLVRILFDDKGNERAREDLLMDLRQRIRDVKMGPDGHLYLLTEEQDGALLIISAPPAN